MAIEYLSGATALRGFIFVGFVDFDGLVLAGVYDSLSREAAKCFTIACIVEALRGQYILEIERRIQAETLVLCEVREFTVVAHTEEDATNLMSQVQIKQNRILFDGSSGCAKGIVL